MRLAKMLWILSIVILLFQGLYYYASLPERMATHFDGSGKPNGWSNRNSFYLSWYGILLGLNLFFYTMSKFMHRIPMSMVNIPNKQYWYSTEERKKLVLERTKDLIFIVLIMTNVYFAVIFEAITRSNTTGEQISPVLLFIPIVIMIVIIIGYLIFGFRKPKNHNGS